LRNVGIAVVIVGLLVLVLQRVTGNDLTANFVKVPANRDVVAAGWMIATGLLATSAGTGWPWVWSSCAAALAGPSSRLARCAG
jgi:hypothetical protein